MATVPDLVGKTEDEAKALANDAHLGVQMAGEEASDQEKGKISRQETAAGTQVAEYTTVKYWVSTEHSRSRFRIWMDVQELMPSRHWKIWALR